MDVWKSALSALFACSLVSCGGSGSSNESKLSNSDIQQVKSELANLGYSDFSKMSAQEVQQLQTALRQQGFGTSDIDKLFVALGVGGDSAEQESQSGERDNGEEDNNSELSTNVIDSSLFGYWKAESQDHYVVIGNASFVEYVDKGGCYEAFPYNLVSNQNNKISVSSVADGSISAAALSLEGGSISAELPIGGIQTYSSVTFIPFGMKGCASNNPIRIEIDFRALPQAIRQLDTTYRVNVFFDVNRNGQFDVGDLNVLLVKRANVNTGGTYAEVPTDLSATITLVNEFSDRIASRSNADNAISASVSGNTLTFQADASQAALLANLSSTTPFYVQTNLSYSSPDRTPYPDMTMQDEGPWLWSESSELHLDRFPDNGYADFSAAIYHDALNDQTGEAGWVDIESITISFN